MKNALMLLGGILMAVAGMIVWDARRPRPVTELAHDLELAWKDHHTIV